MQRLSRIALAATLALAALPLPATGCAPNTAALEAACACGDACACGEAGSCGCQVGPEGPPLTVPPQTAATPVNPDARLLDCALRPCTLVLVTNDDRAARNAFPPAAAPIDDPILCLLVVLRI